ncbi:MAG: hypothetical protein JNM81_16045 [Rhodospirillaceae bacterium]|nr:hypothetical protein [Rhodospirillaceae bacterium]
MRALIRFVLLTAFRDRLFSGLATLVILAFALSLFLGNAALIEQSEAGMVYAAGSTRVILILGLAIFVSFQTQRLFDSREIEAVLSRTLSRGRFVFAYWLGYVLVALGMVAIVLIALLFLYGFSGALVVWCASLFLECTVILAFVLFAGLTLERATTTIFVTLAFYAFCRLIGFFLGIRDATPDIGANRIVNPMLDALGNIIPRLDLMTQSSWLIYGMQSFDQLPYVLGQAILFVIVALAAASFDLMRKQF